MTSKRLDRKTELAIIKLNNNICRCNYYKECNYDKKEKCEHFEEHDYEGEGICGEGECGGCNQKTRCI